MDIIRLYESQVAGSSPAEDITLWCNGSITDSESVGISSNLIGVVNIYRSVADRDATVSKTVDEGPMRVRILSLLVKIL